MHVPPRPADLHAAWCCRAWEAANPKEQPEKAKKKWKFMQKYWHKGAFFQEHADDKRGTAGPEQIYGRDFSEATGEDLFDKSILPKVMQVRPAFTDACSCAAGTAVASCIAAGCLEKPSCQRLWQCGAWRCD
jgi:hypothetical protein